jgi:hypothetical protein
MAEGAQGMLIPMSEQTLQLVLAVVSFSTIVMPLALFGWLIRKSIYARGFQLVDRDGEIIARISADNIEKIEPGDIARLRQRVRQKHDISIRSELAA